VTRRSVALSLNEELEGRGHLAIFRGIEGEIMSETFKDYGRGPICVLILLYKCPHTAIEVSSYCYICVLILLYMCPHTAIYVSSYCYRSVLMYISVLILLYMCPHTAIYVRSNVPEAFKDYGRLNFNI